tara:strand:+ start:582 stop:1139 length:558 start_codon:yes stop_codon:yes gene_type:complete
MSVIGLTWAGAATFLAAGSAIKSGFDAWDWGQDKDDALGAEKDYRDAQIELASDKKDIARDTADLKLDIAASARDFSINKINFGARTSLTDLKDSSENIGKTNLATNEYQARKMEKKAASVYDTYQSGIDSSITNYKNALSVHDLSDRSADVAYEQSVGDIHRNYYKAIEDIETRPDNFFEGLFS